MVTWKNVIAGKNFLMSRNDNAFVKLRHLTATIEIGCTERRELCPWCGGGSTYERSFAITRTSEAEAKYCCHRASCGRAGRLAVWGFRLRQISFGDGGREDSNDSPAQKGKSFTPRLFTGDTCELGDEWFAELLDLYGLRREEALREGWRQELGSGNLVVPVRSPLGVVRGIEVRRSKIQIPHVSGPKTDSYRVLDEPWLGWYRPVATGTTILVEDAVSGSVLAKPREVARPTILVEDAISALKVSRQFQVVCLHGSHISLEMLLEIIGVVGNEEVIVALDKDATGKAIKFVAENRFLAPNFRPVPLEKDLKYVSDAGIFNLMGYLNFSRVLLSKGI